MELFLIVEDDKQIRSFIDFSLTSQGYKCVEASTAKEAMGIIANNKLAAIILDLGLPDMDGVDLIRKVREFSEVPIIIVSARDQVSDKVEALDAGADDYLTKPFSFSELMARLRVVFRRQNTRKDDFPSVYTIADLQIDMQKHRVMKNNLEIHFTPIEFNVLTLLVRNAGKVLTHKYILKEIWGSELKNDEQTLRVFMANIRRKLEINPAKPRYIITEIGVGYRFSDE